MFIFSDHNIHTWSNVDTMYRNVPVKSTYQYILLVVLK